MNYGLQVRAKAHSGRGHPEAKAAAGTSDATRSRHNRDRVPKTSQDLQVTGRGATGDPAAWLFSPAMPDIEAHITGNVWKIEVAVGDTVEDGDTVAILESMKMEIPVESEDDGVVKEIRCEEGQSVSEGDVLVVLE